MCDECPGPQPVSLRAKDAARQAEAERQANAREAARLKAEVAAIDKAVMAGEAAKLKRKKHIESLGPKVHKDRSAFLE